MFTHKFSFMLLVLLVWSYLDEFICSLKLETNSIFSPIFCKKKLLFHYNTKLHRIFTTINIKLLLLFNTISFKLIFYKFRFFVIFWKNI